MEVTSGGEETPLSMVRPCGIRISPNGALDMNESSYLAIGFLRGGLGV